MKESSEIISKFSAPSHSLLPSIQGDSLAIVAFKCIIAQSQNQPASA